MKLSFHILAICFAFLATSVSRAEDQPTVLVVVGAEGTPEFGREFGKWADRWMEASQKRSATFIQIGRDTESESLPDRQRLQTTLEEQSKEPSRPLWIILIGHGTFDGREAKFNLRGPDVTADELTAWLQPIKRPLAIIDCTSASAPLLNKLSATGRVIITATRSGSENSFARFGDYLSAAIADPTADLDKDSQTSLLEAFLAASHRVTEFYQQGGRLASEHALLDDNGDKLGIAADWFEGTRATRSARDGAPLDGPRAHQWHLLLSPAEQTLSPETRATRDALELAMESLRQRKSSLPEAEYYTQLEKILVELARLYESGSATAETQRR